MSVRKYSGFSAVELSIAVISVGLIAVLGYTFYGRLQEEGVIGGTSQSTVADDVPAAPEVKKVQDLDQALKALSGIKPGEDGDSSQLEEQVNEF